VLLAACGQAADQTPVGVEASLSETDPDLIEARRQVEPFRERLADRGIHPDRFAEYLATWPAEKYTMVLRMTTGELPGLYGAEPGTREFTLLVGAKMSDEEREEYRRTRRPRP